MEADRSEKWRNRRLRQAERSFGGLKEAFAVSPADLDTVDGVIRKKPSVIACLRSLSEGPLQDAVDSRAFGMGLAGEVLAREYNTVERSHHVRQQLDEMEDYRPYFSYWVSTVQVVVAIISLSWHSLAPLGVQLSLTSDFVRTERLAYEQVAFYEPANFWIGPKPADLIRLGAKFSPCMRSDVVIRRRVASKQAEENMLTGCCVRNDLSGCMQTTENECSPLLSTFYKWAASGGPGGRRRGPVCGLDPRYCTLPASKPPHEWPDDLRGWPSCVDTLASSPAAAHMTCRVTAKPCCIGIHGTCELRSAEYCAFVGGHFHPEASLCSQVACMQDVCGMLSFASHGAPDQFYRLWTALFLHAGLVHLAITLLVQWSIMRDLERLCGPIRMAVIYFGAGILGNVASAIFVPHRAESGPSGSHFGLLAALCIEVVNAWPLLRQPWRALLKLKALLVLLIALGFLPWVDNFAHLFGFVGGLLLSLSVMPYISIASHASTTRRLVNAAAFTAYLALFIALAFGFYWYPEFDCQACKRFSCLPITPSFCADQNVDFATNTTIAFF